MRKYKARETLFLTKMRSTSISPRQNKTRYNQDIPTLQYVHYVQYVHM